MKASIIRIGNSWGIRIPKAFLEECGFRDTVELEVHNQHLVIRPINRPRTNWDEAFQQMAHRGEDILLDRESFSNTTWDENEWEW
ncbi:AbrB/MazE/SpoVT family DNA-binding domain-containing protein [Desulfobacterota bacterium AH_259_B03_O07]|nr:AbrB/MazE/SpoVT family DNA-binding domain-containing protein [Desulfobacterota bacterium AH_259_B03_O07]